MVMGNVVKNYCVNCEEHVRFPKGKCEQCKGKYDDVVPASYTNELMFVYQCDTEVARRDFKRTKEPLV
jgi:hypothetical protein